MFQKAFITAMGALLVSFGAHAADGGFFIEPGVFQDQGTADFRSSTGLVNFDGDLKGTGLELKIGGHFADIFFLGLDAERSEPQYTSSNYSTNTQSTLAGAVVGVQTPVLGVRLWGSYFPYGTFDQNRDQGLQMKFSEPEIYKVGAGLRVAMVSVNLEYLKGKYRESEIQNNGNTFASFDDADAERESWALGVSFPFSL